MRYPEIVNLPFNCAPIQDCFVPVKPGIKEPEGPGIWAIIKGNALITQKGEEGFYSLPEGDRPEWLDTGNISFCIGLLDGKPLRIAHAGKNTLIPSTFMAEPF